MKKPVCISVPDLYPNIKWKYKSQKSQEIKKEIVTFREAILLLTLLKGKILYKLLFFNLCWIWSGLESEPKLFQSRNRY
jgi:hypothetical protein